MSLKVKNWISRTDYCKVMIIVLVWNDYSNTIKCLDSLMKISYDNWQIIIVDNHSTSDCIDKLRREYGGLTYLINDDNYGYAEGNNIGIRYAIEHEADFIFVVNNDIIVVNPDILSIMVRCFMENKNLGILGSRVLQSNGEGNFYPYNFRSFLFASMRKVCFKEKFYHFMKNNPKGIIPRICVPGCAIMFSKEMISKVGMFNCEFFMFAEENDLCIRAIQHDFIVAQAMDEKTTIYHMGGASYDKQAVWKECIAKRNMIRLLANFHGFNYVFIAVIFFVSFFKNALTLLFKRKCSLVRASFIGVFYGIRWSIRNILGVSISFEYLVEGRAIASGVVRLSRIFCHIHK